MPDDSHRFYRYQHRRGDGWAPFQVRYRETDLWIRARRSLEKEALEAVLILRRQLEAHIAACPLFLSSLQPLPQDPLAPPIVRLMLDAACKAGVGPMAAVAGAMAQEVGRWLEPQSPFLIIENGGDCYMNLEEETTVGVYAGAHSPFSGRIALRLTPDRFPLGICTSSGTVGPSLSFGRADAVTVLARDAALADAAATAVGNLVTSPRQIGAGLEAAGHIQGLTGVLILVEDKLGVWGDLELVPM